MGLQIGDVAPDFTAETTEGRLNFHEWLGGSWGVMFSHPKDFTPVCTTELGDMARLKPEFDKRGAKVIGLSIDPVESHKKWSTDILETQGYAPNYPMIGDSDLAVAKLYGMLPATAGSTSEGRTAADNQTVRCVYVVGPDKKIKLVIMYPMTTGRNFAELLRVLDSLQLTAKFKVATPVNWKPGEDVIIVNAVSDDDAKKAFPKGWRAPKPYIRIVPQPGIVRYKREGIATFDATTETIFKYMSAGNHPHAAFKSHKLAGVNGNTVTIDAEIYNPDGSTFKTIIKHLLDRPNGVQSAMIGGAFDGAKFVHSYTTNGRKTTVDLEGTFLAIPGVSEEDELRMIDGFFTQAFAEDAATLKAWA